MCAFGNNAVAIGNNADYAGGMDQETIITDIERRARQAGVSMNAVCKRAGVNPTTFCRWKKSERNPEPMGATLVSIGKLYDALAQIERTAQRKRTRKAVAA